LNRTYFVWVFCTKSPLGDRRVVREDEHGYFVQTRFQRHVGIRYLGRSKPRFPDSWGGFTGHGPRSKPRTLREFLAGVFSDKPLGRHRVLLFSASQAAMSRYRGNAILAAKHLRAVDLPGIAVCVAKLRIRIGTQVVAVG
jgi:hypothetical protein